MQQYLKQFATHSAYEAVKNNLDKPNVVMCQSEGDVHYNPIREITFNIIEEYDWPDTKTRTVQYSALDGMTWNDWVNSQYNINNYKINAGICYEETYSDFGEWYNVQNNNSDVQSTDTIIENNSYTTRHAGGDPV